MISHLPVISRWWHRPSALLGALGFLLSMSGCKELAGNPGLPAGIPNPSSYNTVAGALGLHNAALFQFELALSTYLVEAGKLTDEFTNVKTGASAGLLLSTTGVTDPLDERLLPEGTANYGRSYTELQQVRGFANLALGALATYDTAPADTAAQHVLRGELYAMEGDAEILLADLFCSGVPLSTVDYQRDITYHPSSTTAQVYQDAIVKFDSALTLGHASDSVVRLAQVGRGRAWLALGQYDSAAAAVASVPTSFQYQVAIKLVQGQGLFTCAQPVGDYTFCQATVSDREGGNGLPFLTSVDPRTTVVTLVPANPNGGGPFVPITMPAKYSAAQNGAGYAPFTVASGVEARLIEAEAQLRQSPSSGQWLTTLNALREDATNLTRMTNQTYTAGTPLPNLSDPGAGNPIAQLDTLFTERANWLFADGHRQGDLRRLIRQYGLSGPKYAAFGDQARVYPAGPFLAPGTGRYGSDVTVPVDPNEAINPLFHGCLDRKP